MTEFEEILLLYFLQFRHLASAQRELSSFASWPFLVSFELSCIPISKIPWNLSTCAVNLINLSQFVLFPYYMVWMRWDLSAMRNPLVFRQLSSFLHALVYAITVRVRQTSRCNWFSVIRPNAQPTCKIHHVISVLLPLNTTLSDCTLIADDDDDYYYCVWSVWDMVDDGVLYSS